MEKKTAICGFLEKHHTGREKAVSSKELERLFYLDGSSLRRYINRLRQDGNPICSDENGYYYAANQQEINATVRRLNGMVTHISNARNGLLYASVMLPDNVSVQININME